MFLRHRHIKVLALVAALGLLAGIQATTAAGASSSASKKQAIRKALRKQVRENPKVVMRKSFLKKASLVSFKLPVTVRLRNSSVPSNPNSASIDLGASLGSRQIGLGGTLPAELNFADSFDGGALGNVDLAILPSDNGGLTSTSIPLLWNDDVDSVALDSGGCMNFTGAAPVAFRDLYDPSGTVVVNPAPFDGSVFGTPGFPVIPGVDGINNIAASNAPGSPFALGSNPDPFPGVSTSVADTVLRTGPLTLKIAETGLVTLPNGQEISIGRSGGQANLFGNIPGKDHGIDVTVSLATAINSILRAVDSDPQRLRLTQNWPAAAFECRQAWSGAVDNYLQGIRLEGDLKISPAIMPDGKLRIAKATLSSLDGEAKQVALGACLFPHETFASGNVDHDNSGGTPNINTDTTNVTVPFAPINPGAFDPPPSVPCNSTPTELVSDAGVTPLAPADTDPADGFTTTESGSRAVVAGDLTVDNVEADILVGNALP